MAIQWEYKEITSRDIQELARKEGGAYIQLRGDYSVANALDDFWVTWESQLREELKEEFEQGWEPDPTGWGPSCIEYRITKAGMSRWSCMHWLFYILIGFSSAGLGFLIGPFIWRWEFVEPVRIKVRLRRLQQGYATPQLPTQQSVQPAILPTMPISSAGLWLQDAGSGHRYPVGYGVTTIGRAPDNHIVLNHPSASGHHAEVRFENGRFVLYDKGSTNGTFVNGRRIIGPNMIRAGWRVRFGEQELHVM